MTQTISSLQGFIRKIGDVTPAADEVLLYRGHSDRSFVLLPSVLREAKFRDAEESIVRELIASHPSEFANDRTTLDRLARMQHYLLPTRLLDVTWNPLVSLYFAANNHDNKTGEVIVFRVKKTQVKYYDSDTVSCISNLAYLSVAEKIAIDFGLPGDQFHNQRSIVRLLHAIRDEKPSFRPEIVPQHLQSVVCVKPKNNNQRILAQSGAFLLFGLADALDSSPAPGITVERIKINAKHKASILRDLDRVGINNSTMFPEIEKAALYIRNKI